MKGPVMGWTLDKARNVRVLYESKTSFHPGHARKLAERAERDVLGNLIGKNEAKFQLEVVRATNGGLGSSWGLGTKWLDAAEHGEGCRGKFLAKRSHATHDQKI